MFAVTGRRLEFRREHSLMPGPLSGATALDEFPLFILKLHG
jgi:hypothetical protein